MKSISTLFTLMLIFTLGIKAQLPVVVSEDSLKVGKTSLPALMVTIPEVNYETTMKAWIKELESGTKSKVVTENNEMTIFGAKFKDISSNPVNVYSKLTKLDSLLQLKVSFELKKDQYIDRTGTTSEFSKAENYLKQFAKNQYIILVKDQVDTEDKKLRDLQRDLSSLEKDKTRIQKTIESENTGIVTENDNITVQNNALASVTSEIIEQNNELISISDDKMKNAKKDYINGLEKRKKKIQNLIETSQNRINKANNDIDKANAEIPRNDKMQEQVNDKIQAQQAVLGKFTDKLKKIKSY